jgi:hypothetical protein
LIAILGAPKEVCLLAAGFADEPTGELPEPDSVPDVCISRLSGGPQKKNVLQNIVSKRIQNRFFRFSFITFLGVSR